MFNCCKNVTNFIYLSRTRMHNSIVCSRKCSLIKAVPIAENFESIKEKNRNAYLQVIDIFKMRDLRRRSHVEFIYSALKNMESFNVHRDLEVYKALVDVLPKGKFIPTNMFQAEFMHYPKQQQCAIDLLEQMEDNGVMPDEETEDILLNIFRKSGYPLRKFWRMMYWMPKFKNLSPWPLPACLPDDMLELAKLVIARINKVDVQSKLTVYEITNGWIVSAQSETQSRLLNEHDSKTPLHVRGPFNCWAKNKRVNYFVLQTDPKPTPKNVYDNDDVSNITIPLLTFVPLLRQDVECTPTVHEQEDGVIFAVCASDTSTSESLLLWIRHLENDGNPILASLSIVFTLNFAQKEVAVTNLH